MFKKNEWSSSKIVAIKGGVMKNRKTVVTKVVDYIASNLEEDVSIDDIAGTFYFNRHYLMKLFKKETGLTITQYRNYQKIINSMDDLIYTDDKILKIALNHGFHSLEYYSEMFYKVVGMSPLQFRKYGFSLSTPKEEDSEMTRLDRIQSDLKELKKLREQLLGEEEKTSSKVRKDPPKVLVLNRENQKKAA